MSCEPSHNLAEAIKELAAACGYVACGITSAESFFRDRAAVEERIRRFPELRGLYQGFTRRTDPRLTAPWCNSVVVAIRWYGKYDLPEQAVGHIGREYLGDCRYPGCPDHAMASRMIEGMRRLGLRCRKGGVPDRWAAARAGVARFGRNCSVYADGYGSWINIQTWRVDAVLPPDEPTLTPACPEGCTACIDACPTGAIVEPFCMRMDRCIAYLTYAAPPPVEEGLWQRMGEWIYGCDVCQQVCPLNRGRWQKIEPAGWLAAVADLLTPAALAEMDEATYRTVIHPRFWYIGENDLARWRRNARRAVAAGNARSRDAD